MKLDLAGKSLLLFGLSVVFLIALTLLESALAGVSLTVERAITFFLLVLPPAIGTAFGVLSLIRREGRTWLAVTGAVLNALFALFHSAIVLFAG
jgi:hypothetical protein